eukprot:scaffold208065_cov27-Tisochrysis_lutea.AAC.1
MFLSLSSNMRVACGSLERGSNVLEAGSYAVSLLIAMQPLTCQPLLFNAECLSSGFTFRFTTACFKAAKPIAVRNHRLSWGTMRAATTHKLDLLISKAG